MKRNGGFSLTEMILAMSISVLVGASLVTMVIMGKRTWAEGSAIINLQSNGRLVLNQIIRGSYGLHGLREANYDTLAIDEDGKGISFIVDKNDPPTYTKDDDTKCRFYLQNARIWFDPNVDVAEDEYKLVSHGRIEDIQFIQNSSCVTIELTMKDYASPRADAFIKLTTDVFLRKAREVLH